MKRPNALVSMLILLTLTSVIAAYPAYAEPAITLTPNSGPVGTVVSVTGSGFSISDTCGSGSFASSTLNMVVGSTSCSMLSGTITSAGFTVAGGQTPGAYTVVLTGGTLDSAQATFTVTAGTSMLVLTPAAGATGTFVSLSGSGYSAPITAATCPTELSNSGPSGSAVLFASTPVCSVSSAGILSGSFTVAGGLLAGVYTVTLTDTHAIPSGAVSASLTVSYTPPTILLAPTSGQRGVTVAVSGSGFAPSDTSVMFSSTPTGLGASGSCTVSGGTISLGCSFTVLSSAPYAGYTVIAKGNVGDSASATFTVTNTATISLAPTSGPLDATVVVSGSGFSPSDTSVMLGNFPTAPSLGAGGVTCPVSSGTISAGCSFTVSATAALVVYSVTATGITASDSASTTFAVIPPTITLAPISGPGGTTVVVSGSGFNPSDTKVTLASIASGLWVGSVTCSVLSGSIVSGCSFTVRRSAPNGGYAVTATGNALDSASAPFTVGPVITLVTTATVTSSQAVTSSTSTTSTFSTSTSSTISTTSTVVTGTTTLTTTVTGKTAGTSTTVFTSIISTGISTSLTTSVGTTTTQTGVTTISTGASSTTSTGTMFTTTISGGTQIVVTETNTFTVLLTTIFQELHQFADETLTLLGFHVTATPVGQKVNEIIVTTASTTSKTSTTSTTSKTSTTSTTQVAMIVSYSVVGGGTPTAPAFHYVSKGASLSVTLTTTPTSVLVDAGSTWSVSPNPLTGSTPSESWYALPSSLKGTASATTIVFTFQNYYYLTMSVSGPGTVTPSSGWHIAGTKVTITATPTSGHKFDSWTGSGTGSYTGTSASTTITMSSAITETATFT